MTTITFDTLELVQQLAQAGIPEDQAKAIVRTIRDAQGHLLTREYFDQRLSATINEAKVDLIKWGAGMLLAQAGLVTALVKLL